MRKQTTGSAIRAVQFPSCNMFACISSNHESHLGTRVGFNILLDDGHIFPEIFTNRRRFDAAVVVNDTVHGALVLGHIYKKVKRLGCGGVEKNTAPVVDCSIKHKNEYASQTAVSSRLVNLKCAVVQYIPYVFVR